MSGPSPSEELRSLRATTAKLLSRVTTEDKKRHFRPRHSSEYAGLLAGVVSEIVGRDASSAIGKAVRIFIPIYVILIYGQSDKKVQILLAAGFLYSTAAILYVFARYYKNRGLKEKIQTSGNRLNRVATLGLEAMSFSGEMLERQIERTDPAYQEAMKKLSDANKEMLIELEVPNRMLNEGQHIDDQQSSSERNDLDDSSAGPR